MPICLNSIADSVPKTEKIHPMAFTFPRRDPDALFFTEDIAVDETARGAVSDIATLAQSLAESTRWSDERARELLADVLACGPVSPVT